MGRLLASALNDADSSAVPAISELEQHQIALEGRELIHEHTLASLQYESLCQSAKALDGMATTVRAHAGSLESLHTPIRIATHGHLEDLSLEGFGDFLKKVWEAIVRAWNRVKDMIKKLVNWLLGRGTKAQEDTVKEAKRNLDRDDTIEANYEEIRQQQVKNDAALDAVERSTDVTREFTKKLKSNPDADVARLGEAMDALLNFDVTPTGQGNVGEGSVTTVAANDYINEVDASIKSTKKLAETVNKAVDTKDEATKVIGEIVSKADDGSRDVAEQLNKFKSDAVTQASNTLNEAARVNINAAKAIMAKLKNKKRLGDLTPATLPDLRSARGIYAPGSGGPTTTQFVIKVVETGNKSSDNTMLFAMAVDSGLHPLVAARRGRMSTSDDNGDALEVRDFMKLAVLDFSVQKRGSGVPDPAEVIYKVRDLDPKSKTYKEIYEGSLDNQSNIDHLVQFEIVKLW